MDRSKLGVLLPVALFGCVLALVIALSVSLFLGGSLTAVPASLGGGGNGSPAWHGVVVVVGLPTVTAVGFKKTLDYLDRAPPSRR